MHEASHACVALALGLGVEEIRLGPSSARPDQAGGCVFGDSGDLFSVLVATLAGPLGEGESVAWPPRADPRDPDSWAAGLIVSRLGLSKADFQFAVSLARHYLDDTLIGDAVELLAAALDLHGDLDEMAIKRVLGKGRLEFLRRGYAPREEAAA
jgi:hypothetical protein